MCFITATSHVFVLEIIQFNYVSSVTGGNPTWLLGRFGLSIERKHIFFLSSCLACFGAHLQPPWLSSYESSNLRNRVEENNIQANPFINNRGWEQRVNAPNTRQKAALGAVGSPPNGDVGILKTSVPRYPVTWFQWTANNTAMFTSPASLWGFIPKWWKSQKVSGRVQTDISHA